MEKVPTKEPKQEPKQNNENPGNSNNATIKTREDSQSSLNGKIEEDMRVKRRYEKWEGNSN